MAFDTFLKIDGIEGESTDERHSGEIEVIKYDLGVTHPSSAARGSSGQASATRAVFADLSIVKAVDTATPKLFLYCISGKRIPTATLTVCRSTGKKDKYLEIKLKDVLVSAVEPAGESQAAGTLPTETVKLNYGQIEISYIKTDHKTGLPSGGVKMNWNIDANSGG